MKPFQYYAPQTLSGALDILAAHADDACVVAGGTDLLLKMKAGQVAPKVVVNIKRVPEMRGIGRPLDSDTQSPVRIGALTTVEELLRSPVIRMRYPALAEAAATMASVQIRNLATVGGNLCNAAPSADLVPILIALEASAMIAGRSGERIVPLESFFLGPGATVLAPDELLVAIEVPPAAGRATYLKCAPRACMDIAVVGIGIALRLNGGRCDGARVALGAVAPTPVRARRAEQELTAGPLTPDRIDCAARLAAEESQPISDVRGPAWYRTRMVEVLTRRGLNQLTAPEPYRTGGQHDS